MGFLLRYVDWSGGEIAYVNHSTAIERAADHVLVTDACSTPFRHRTKGQMATDTCSTPFRHRTKGQNEFFHHNDKPHDLVSSSRSRSEFKSAIEQKQVAQQEAERKKYELEKERIEKERKIIAAEGDAESIRLRGEGLSHNPALIQYEYVQKITPGIQTIITDGRSILSLGDLVRSAPIKTKQ